MATAFDLFSGVNARIKAVAITPDLATDMVTSAGTTTAWLEKTGYNIDGSAEGPGVVTANSPADAEGNIGEIQLRGSIVKDVITLDGLYNGGTVTTDARFKKGGFVKMDIIFHGTYGLGYYALLCKVVGRKVTAKIGPEAIAVSVTLKLSGLLPAPSTS